MAVRYATADDMRAAYEEKDLVQLTNTAEWDATTVAKINTQIEIASAEVDGYVAKQYSPAADVPVPVLLVQLTLKIAYCGLARSPEQDAKEERDQARKTLRDIASGLVKIDGGDTTLLDGRDGAILLEDAGRKFSRDTLAGF